MCAPVFLVASALLCWLPSTTFGQAPVESIYQTNFTSTWMETVAPAIGSLSLLDLMLPGTHDTLTYDLSTALSEGMDMKLNSTLLYRRLSETARMIPSFSRSIVPQSRTRWRRASF